MPAASVDPRSRAGRPADRQARGSPVRPPAIPQLARRALGRLCRALAEAVRTTRVGGWPRLRFPSTRPWDHRYGGVSWEVAADGEPLRPHKHALAQASAMLALAEYWKASGDDSALDLARQTFARWDHTAHDPVYGGYAEMHRRDWSSATGLVGYWTHDPSVRTLDTHFHSAEGLAALHRVAPRRSWRCGSGSCSPLVPMRPASRAEGRSGSSSRTSAEADPVYLSWTVSNPLVSVIVAVRNGERFLPAALASIEQQDYRPIEVVVVDGHSSDRTAEIARTRGVRVVVQTGRGIGDAYNAGIAAAQGPLVAFLSHDDLWTNDKLSTQVRFLDEHPEVQFTVARVRFFLEPGCDPPRGFRSELFEGDHVGRIMETLVARREVFDLVGGFDVELPFGEDSDWYARAADLGVAIAVLPRVLLEKRVHGANASIQVERSKEVMLRVLCRAVARKRGAADI